MELNSLVYLRANHSYTGQFSSQSLLADWHGSSRGLVSMR